MIPLLDFIPFSFDYFSLEHFYGSVPSLSVAVEILFLFLSLRLLFTLNAQVDFPRFSPSTHSLPFSDSLSLSLQGFSSIFPFPHSLFTASPIFPPHSASSTTGENTPPSFPGLWVMTRLVSRGGPSPLRISSRPFFSSGYSTTEAIFSFCTFSLSFFFFYFPPLFFLCNISLSYYFITLFFFPELLFFKNL